jgi:hypothetical protein
VLAVVLAVLFLLRPFNESAEASRFGRLMAADLVQYTGLLVVLGFFFLLVILVIGVGVMFFDLAGRREEDAEWLQMKIIDAIRQYPVLADLHILPVVYVPMGKHATVKVELSGEVPSEAARGAVLVIVQETARKLRREIEIDERLAISRQGAASEGAARAA